mgnify:FL=1|jgi:hypothetical protein
MATGSARVRCSRRWPTRTAWLLLLASAIGQYPRTGGADDEQGLGGHCSLEILSPAIGERFEHHALPPVVAEVRGGACGEGYAFAKLFAGAGARELARRRVDLGACSVGGCSLQLTANASALEPGSHVLTVLLDIGEGAAAEEGSLAAASVEVESLHARGARLREWRSHGGGRVRFAWPALNDETFLDAKAMLLRWHVAPPGPPPELAFTRLRVERLDTPAERLANTFELDPFVRAPHPRDGELWGRAAVLIPLPPGLYAASVELSDQHGRPAAVPPRVPPARRSLLTRRSSL